MLRRLSFGEALEVYCDYAGGLDLLDFLLILAGVFEGMAFHEAYEALTLRSLCPHWRLRELLIVDPEVSSPAIAAAHSLACVLALDELLGRGGERLVFMPRSEELARCRLCCLRVCYKQELQLQVTEGVE